VSSNISQSYPYSSETEAERAAAIAALEAATAGLAAKIAEEASPLDDHERSWTWICRRSGCGGTLHVAGYARDRHALYAVCDRCAGTFLR
jgi:hypothetical protein